GCRGARGGNLAAAKHRTDAGDQLAQLTRLGEVIVGAELEADDAVDGARRRGEHDDRHARALLEGAHDGEPVLLRHVEVEDDEVSRRLLEQLAQGGTAVALAHLEAVGGEILSDHFTRGRLVVDDDDVLDLSHAASRRAGSATVKVVPRPPPGLSAVTW